MDIDDAGPSDPWTADEPGAVSLEETLRDLGRDEQEEWEYEYSSTEKETFYLTLDLSYPEFHDRVSKAPHISSRGGFYKNWLEQPYAGAAGSSKTPIDLSTTQSTPQPARRRGEGDDDQESPEPDTDDDMQDVHPLMRDKGKGKERAEPLPVSGPRRSESEKTDSGSSAKTVQDEVQILELHSDHPIISYRGRIFEGDWAEVIGTEMIMARHDEQRPLPALRNLEDGVDLLGAVCSRITTKEKKLQPKEPEVDTLAPIREEWNIRVPAGRDKTGERQKQARFLENLMALKIKKGETDLVTVYAKEGAGKDFDDDRDPDYKPRVVRSKRSSRRARAGRQRGSGGRRGGSAASESLPVESSIVSTPTPSEWPHLFNRGLPEQIEGQDNEGSGAEGYSDISGPGEAMENERGRKHSDEDAPMAG